MEREYYNRYLNIFLLFVFILIFILSFGCSLKKKDKKEDAVNTSEIPHIKSLQEIKNGKWVDVYNGRAGDKIKIVGDFFGKERGSSYVLFNTTKVSETEYEKWIVSEIKVSVPTNATTGPVKVVTANDISNSINFRIIKSPKILSFSPKRVSINYDTLVMNGESFGTTAVELKAIVKIDTTKIIDWTDKTSFSFIAKWSDTLVKLIVPENAAKFGKINIKTTEGTDTTLDELIVVKKPVILNFEPNLVYEGSTINIYGVDFIDTNSSFVEYVTIGENTVATNNGSENWTDNYINISIPFDIVSGDIVVHTYNGDSNALRLDITADVQKNININSVGEVYDTSSYLSTAYDSAQDKLHIGYTYVNSSISYIGYASKKSDEENWVTANIDEGIANSLVIDKDGNPNIVYYSGTNILKYAHISSQGAVDINIVLDQDGGNLKLKKPSISSAIDSSNIIHVVYNFYDTSNRQIIKYMQLNTMGTKLGASTSFLDKDETKIYTQVALSLKNDNLPFIAVTTGYPLPVVTNTGKMNRVNFFENSNNNWETTKLLKSDYSSFFGSSYAGIDLKRDISGNIQIAFIDGNAAGTVDSTGITQSGGILYSVFSPQNKSFKVWEKIYPSDDFKDSWNNHLNLFLLDDSIPGFIFTHPENDKYSIIQLEFSLKDQSWLQAQIITGINNPNIKLIQDKLKRKHIIYYDSGFLKEYIKYTIIK